MHQTTLMEINTSGRPMTLVIDHARHHLILTIMKVFFLLERLKYETPQNSFTVTIIQYSVYFCDQFIFIRLYDD
jgi:hypothetical protein